MFRRKDDIFKWPPKMPSMRPKQKKQYRHEVTVASSENAEYAYTLYFTSEKKARDFKRTVLESTNNPIVEYQRKELPVVNGEWIEQ
jgi:PhoPQ-activated pathogenicity-related protein